MPLKVNAFSSQRDQEAAVSLWRKKSIDFEIKNSNLLEKIQRGKLENQVAKTKVEWIEDMRVLQKEEEVCLKSLNFLGEDFTAQCFDKSLYDSLHKQLKEIDYLVLKRNLSDRSLLKSKIESFESFLEEEKYQVDANISDSSEVSAFLHVQDAVLASFLKAKEDITRDSMPNESEPFFRALSLEKDEIVSQLHELKIFFFSDPRVLQSAQCLVEIESDSRRYTSQLHESKMLTDRLHSIFPHLSSKDVSTAIKEALLLKKQAVRLKNLQRHVKSVIADIVTSHKIVVQGKSTSAQLLQLIRAEENLINERKDYLSTKLEIQKKVLHEKKEHQQWKENEEREELEKQKAFQDEQRLKEFISRLKLLEDYEKCKKEAKDKEKEILLVQEEEAKEKRKMRMIENNKRVIYRRQCLVEKQKEYETEKHELERLRHQKEDALLRFFQSVQEKMGVEASFERVLQSTKSSEQSECYITAAQIREGKLFGFSDEKIMRDPRVRLYHALLGAGLHKTEYGRQKVTEGFFVSPAMRASEGNPFANLFP